MRDHVFLHIASEELEEYQDLCIEAEPTNNFQHLKSLELKDFNFLFASFGLLGYLKHHVDPRLVLFGVRHVLVVIGDENYSCSLKHPVYEFRIH